ncbi:MAG: hypothetical protein ABR591_13690 [Candidatus Velthaea sp.]
MAARAPAPVCDARIVVTGTGSAEGTARTLLRAELRDVRYVAFPPANGAPPPDLFDGVDMLVFVAHARDTPDAAHTVAVAGVARSRGTLVSAVLVSAEPLVEHSPLLAVLRDAADNVMIVRDAASVPAILRALR